MVHNLSVFIAKGKILSPDERNFEQSPLFFTYSLWVSFVLNDFLFAIFNRSFMITGGESEPRFQEVLRGTSTLIKNIKNLRYKFIILKADKGVVTKRLFTKEEFALFYLSQL